MGLCFSLSARKERVAPERGRDIHEEIPRSYVAARILPIDIRGTSRPAKPHL